MSGLPKPCLTCGVLAAESYCPEHTPRPPDRRRGRDRSHMGRDAAWDRLSKRARALQPFCGVCGTTEDLTADHLPIAWAAIRSRRAVTLRMVEVVCRGCNSSRGPADLGSDRWCAWWSTLSDEEQSDWLQAMWRSTPVHNYVEDRMVMQAPGGVRTSERVSAPPGLAPDRITLSGAA